MNIDKNLTNDQKLQVIYEMTIENHEILKTVRRQQYLSSAFRIFYWLIILGVIGGAYIYVRPLIEVFTHNTDQIESSFSNLKASLPEGKILIELMEAYQKMKSQ